MVRDTHVSRRDLLRRGAALGLSLPVLAALWAACGGDDSSANGDGTNNSSDSTQTNTPDGSGTDERPVLRFAAHVGDLGTADPHFGSGSGDRIVIDMVFNGLLRYKPGNSAEIEPDIAEALPEPEMVDGKQRWTFRIRKGVMVHPSSVTDAYELTAEDVLYSLQKAADPNRSSFAGEYSGMTFEQVDDYAVAVIMDEPISTSLFYPKFCDYSGGNIVPKKPIEALGDEAFKTQPVGTGPFIFKEYRPQDRILLVAHDDYFRGAPKLGGVEYRFVADSAARELALRSGDVDCGLGLSEAAWVERIDGVDGLKVDVIGVEESVLLHFNMSMPPLDDIRVRQAIAYAIDRDAHVAVFGEPVARPLYSIVPPDLLAGGLTKEEARERGALIEFDLAKARQLMAEAGLEQGFSISVVSSEAEFMRRPYELLQPQLAEIGIDLKVQLVEHAAFHAQIRENVNALVSYPGYRPNADAYLTRFFHSESIVVTGAKPDTNFSHYDKVDDLIEQARVETDPDAQAELWKQATAQIFKDVAAYPINTLAGVWARSENLDWGHEPISSLALYPQITEKTTIQR